MNKKLLNKKLPAFFSLFLVTISLVTITWLGSNAIIFGTKAALGNIPKNVQISNITDTSFTISYTTDESVLGTIAYGKDKDTGGVALDDRDQMEGKPLPHRVHHITVQGVDPSTTYYVAIASGSETFLNKQELYQVTTAPPALDDPTSQEPLAGKASLDDGSIPAEAIAYVQTDSSQLLSALLKPDGSYLIPLNSMRTADFSTYVAFSPSTELSISVVSPTLQSSLTTLAGQANPVPLITLSKNYDFSMDDSSASESASASNSAALNSPGLPEMNDTTIVSTPEITIPKDTQTFTDQKPRFSGKATPDSEVEIIINSTTEIKTTVQADSYGNWSFRPSSELEPGNHTITINAFDAQGIMQSISNSFTVYAEGGQFIEPSVITPTVKPTTAVVLTATPVPTAIPTIAPTATTIPTISNGNGNGTNGTISPAPSGGQNGPTSPPIPASGNEVVAIAGFASVISLIIGGILFTLL